MAQVVCQVTRKPGRMSIVWSAGTATFEPIHLEADALRSFEEAARNARTVLTRAACGDAAASAQLGLIGRDLYARFFGAGIGPEIASWLRGLADVDSLEIGTDSPGRIPFAIFEDPSAPGAWGRRYALTVGRRVSPLRTFGQIAAPRVLVVVDPSVELDAARRTELDVFLSRENGALVTSRLQLEEALDQNVPDVVWILARIEGGAWILAGERVSPQRLADIIRHADAGNSLPIIVSTGVGQPEAVESWECFLSAATSALPGLVALETPVSVESACATGLLILRSFLDDKLPIARALQQVRLGAGAVGLALAAFVPPRVRVLTDGDLETGPANRPLPTEPYHPLRPLEREDRALLIGREEDIQNCALLIDQPNTAGLLIHGRSGVGKASLVRAGLLPFLEEENRGFYVLRDRSDDVPADKEFDQPTLALRVGPDLAGSLVLGLTAFAARPLDYTTPTGRSVRVNLPEIMHGFIAGTPSPNEIASSVQRLDADPRLPVIAPVSPMPPVDPAIVWDKVQESPAALAELMDRLTRDLPFEILIPLEQLDDIVVLPAARKRSDLATDVLRELSKSPARCQIVATMRTEFLGQLNVVFGGGPARGAWKEFFLDELSEDALKDVLLAPTSAEPLLYSSEAPAGKYQFGFEAGTATAVLEHAKLQGRTSSYAPLQIVHAVAKQLFDTSVRRGASAVRESDVKRIAKTGAVEGLVAATIKAMPLPAAAGKALRNVVTKLHRKQGSVVTRHLTPVDSLKQSWRAAMPFEEALNVAAEYGPLVEIQNLLVDGKDSVQITVPHEALALFGDQETQTVAKRSFAHARILDALFIIIPLAILGMALTFFLTRRYSAAADTSKAAMQKAEFEKNRAREFGALSTRYALYSGIMAQADAALQQGNTLRARQLLLTQQPAGGANDIRGFEWHYLWRKINGEEATLLGHKAQIRVLAMSPDGKSLASGDEGGNVFLWNLDDLKEPMVARLKGLTGPVKALAFAPDGASVGAADGGTKILVWDTAKPEKTVAELDPKAVLTSEGKGVLALAFVGPGFVAAGDQDSSVAVFDVAQKKAKWIARDHTAPVTAMTALDGGKKLVSASRAEVIAWTDEGKKAKEHKDQKAQGIVEFVALSPYGDEPSKVVVAANRKVAGADVGTFGVWNMGDGVWTAGGDVDSVITAGVCLPNVSSSAAKEQRFVTAGAQQTLSVHAVDGKQNVEKIFGHTSGVRSLAAGGTRLASVGYDPAIKVWDAKRSSSSDQVHGHDRVMALAFDPSERILASAGSEGSIIFWDAAAGRPIGKMKSSGAPITCMAFSPKSDSLLLAFGSGNDAQLVDVSLDKDAVTTKPLATLKKHAGMITCLAFNEDGKSIATGGLDQTVNIWSVGDAKGPKKTLEVLTPVTSLYFDSQLLFTGDSHGMAIVWDANGGGVAFPPYQAHGSAIHALSLIRQVKLRGIASVSADQTFRTWAADSSAKRFVNLATYRGHSQAVTSLVQGKGFFATGGADGSVKFWDYTLQDERFTFALTNNRPVRALALANNRAILAVGDDSGAITFIRSQPQPAYGPAIAIVENEREEP